MAVPLITSASGTPPLQAKLPPGTGMRAEGPESAQDATTATSTLISALESRDPATRTAVEGPVRSFMGSVPGSQTVQVRTITPTLSSTTAPTDPIVISGASSGDEREALVLDISGLPSGTVLQLDNVDFAVIVGAARITGGEGSNYVVGDSGSQYIVLGADDDTLDGGEGDDTVGSEGGNDLLTGGSGNDQVRGGADNDSLYGNAGSDTVYGNIGSDMLFGGRDADSLFGGQGNDTLSGDIGEDYLLGDRDADLVQGGSGADLLYGNAGADQLYGNAGNDTLYGGQEADTLYGGQGNDRLSGDLGNDVLSGDLGADTLTGGGGADQFRFNAQDQGGDVITDFQSGTDTIVLYSPNFGNVAAGRLDAAHFALAGQENANTRFVFNTATGTLTYDGDGSGSAQTPVTIASFIDQRSLSADNIVLVTTR